MSKTTVSFALASVIAVLASSAIATPALAEKSSPDSASQAVLSASPEVASELSPLSARQLTGEIRRLNGVDVSISADPKKGVRLDTATTAVITVGLPEAHQSATGRLSSGGLVAY